MSRLVRPQFEARPGDSTRSGGRYEGAPETTSSTGSTGSADGDEYASRVAKYIPSEVLAGYLTLEGVLNPVYRTVAPGGSGLLDAISNQRLAVGIFLVGLIFTPLYILTFGIRNKAPWVTHAIMATLAFCVWAYAMRGSIFYFPVGDIKTLYDGTLAAAVLVVFSLASGLIKPHGSAG